jgi:hypothetical protein
VGKNPAAGGLVILLRQGHLQLQGEECETIKQIAFLPELRENDKAEIPRELA